MMAETEKKSSKCLFYLRNIATFLVSHIGLVSLVVGYCIMGAFTFEALEADHERQVKRQMRRIREGVTDTLWQLTINMSILHEDLWTAEAMNTLQDFETTLIESMKKKGWDGSEDVTEVQWTFAGALFYSIILITTIGYGHIAPKTQWGKVVTIFYAILGIPLMLLCLANIGDAMAHSFRFLYWKVCCYICTRQPKNKAKLRRTRTLRSSARVRDSSRSRPTSLRRSQRLSQRSADSAISDSALSRSSNSVSDMEMRYYEDTDQELEMGSRLQRGRASQHANGNRTLPKSKGSNRSKASSATNDSGLGPTTAKSLPDSDAFFNKYAEEEQEVQFTPEIPTKHEKVRSPSSRKREPTTDSQDLDLDEELPEQRPRGRPRERENRERGLVTSQPSRMEQNDRGSTRYSNKAMSPTRLGRLEEEEDDDYGYTDYDYEISDEEYPAESHHNRPVPIWLSILLVVSYIFGGAFLFAGWEKWSFLDSAYFCFITLTTIGFGDFVPAQNVKENVEVSIALCSLYLLFGIALLAMSFNLVQFEVTNSVKSVAKRLGIIKDDEDEVE